MNSFDMLSTAHAAVREWVQIYQRGGEAKVYATPSGCQCLEAPVLRDARLRRPAKEVLGKRAWGSLTPQEKAMTPKTLACLVTARHIKQFLRIITILKEEGAK